jgi:hypothetical protein
MGVRGGAALKMLSHVSPTYRCTSATKGVHAALLAGPAMFCSSGSHNWSGILFFQIFPVKFDWVSHIVYLDNCCRGSYILVRRWPKPFLQWLQQNRHRGRQYCLSKFQWDPHSCSWEPILHVSKHVLFLELDLMADVCTSASQNPALILSSCSTDNVERVCARTCGISILSLQRHKPSCL